MARPKYREPDGTYITPWSEIDAMYLHAAAIEAHDGAAASFFENEAKALAARDLADGL